MWFRLPAPKRRPLNRQPKTRSEVFSYYSSRSDNEESVGRQQSSVESHGRNWLKLAPTVLAGAAIMASVGYVLTLTTNPKISPVNTNPNQQTFLRDPAQYQQGISQILRTSLWNRTKLTLNPHALSTKIQSQFPELSDVAISVPLISRRPIVQLAAANPALILNSNGSSYVLDTVGRAIIASKDADRLDTSSVPTVTDASGLPLKLGKTSLIPDEVSFIRQVFGQLKAKKLAIGSITLPALPNELHVRFDGQPYYIKFDMLGNARQQVGTLLAVKTKLDHDHRVPGEYIDVRIEERAYFK